MAVKRAGNLQDAKPPGSGSRWQKGQSGNPAGRVAGVRNKRSVLAAGMLDGESEAILRRCIEQAKTGEPVAMRLCVERIIPRLRGSVVQLPGLSVAALGRAEDLAVAAGEIIAAAAAGDLSIDEARQFMDLLEKQRRLIETVDLAIRIEALEFRQQHGREPAHVRVGLDDEDDREYPR